MNAFLLTISFFACQLVTSVISACPTGTVINAYDYCFYPFPDPTTQGEYLQANYEDAKQNCATSVSGFLQNGLWRSACWFSSQYFNGSYWAGIHKADDGTWTYSDGAYLDESNWAYGFPLDGHSCAVANRVGDWESVDCSTSHYFLCLIPSTTNVNK